MEAPKKDYEKLIRGAESALHDLPMEISSPGEAFVRIKEIDLAGLRCAIRIGIAEMEKLK